MTKMADSPGPSVPEVGGGFPSHSDDWELCENENVDDPECMCWKCRALVAEGANNELRGIIEANHRALASAAPDPNWRHVAGKLRYAISADHEVCRRDATGECVICEAVDTWDAAERRSLHAEMARASEAVVIATSESE